MRIPVDLYHKPQLKHQLERCQAFVEGMRAAGDEPVVRIVAGDAPAPDPADVSIFWSGRFPAVTAALREAGRRYLLLEESRWNGNGWGATVGWDGYHGSAKFYADAADKSRRWVHGLKAKAWRDNPDGCALIFGQVPGDFATRDMPKDFYERAIRFFLKAGVPVVYRPHPSGRPGMIGPEVFFDRVARDNKTPLSNALKAARLSVSWTTTAGCDAVAAGVPSIIMGRDSMAFGMGADDLTLDPPTPDRSAWLNHLGQTEWRWDEIRAGVAWAQLRAGVEEILASREAAAG
jgi:hypothetical protein